MANEERSAESTWLYNRPERGIAEDWFNRNRSQLENGWGDPWILDTTFILNAAYETWTPGLRDRYSQEQTFMTKEGPEVPPQGSELWQIWQAYTQSDTAKDDFNGSKLHLHRYSRVLTDTNLRLDVSQYDWHRMRSLGMGLREGTVPEHYRDTILPVRTEAGFVFEPTAHPNNLVIHVAVITSDNYLLLTQKPPDADYYPGTIAASIEEQMHGQRDNSPFDTLERAINKVGGEELKLTLIPNESRLAAMILEPDVNALGFVMVAKVEESSDQIDARVLGADRAEFDPRYKVGKASLEDPDELIQQFYNPRNILWHGTSRVRIIAALSYIHGYEETLNMLFVARY